MEKLPEESGGYMPLYASHFCSEEKAREVQEFFAPRVDSLSGGPRHLAETLESIRLCAAQVARHRPGTTAFFESVP
jgi:hypothetical protein